MGQNMLNLLFEPGKISDAEWKSCANYLLFPDCFLFFQETHDFIVVITRFNDLIKYFSLLKHTLSQGKGGQ